MEEELSSKCNGNLTEVEVITVCRLIEIVDGFVSYWLNKPGQAHSRAKGLRKDIFEAIELLNYPNYPDEKRSGCFIQKWYTSIIDTKLEKALVTPRKASVLEKKSFCEDREEFSDNSKWVWRQICDRTEKLVESRESAVKDNRPTKKRKEKSEDSAQKVI